jgi:integrase
MAKGIHRLTAKQVARLHKPGRYGDGHGLYLQVVSAANRSWLFRYQRGHHLGDDGHKIGTERTFGLGPLHTVSLEEAREAARNLRQQLRAGVPIGRAKSYGKTFQQCTEEYYAANKAGWKSAVHRANWLSTVQRYAYPVLGPLPVAQINTQLVLRVVGPLWTSKPKTAQMVRQRIQAVLDFATAHGSREGENPARLEGNLKHLLPRPERVKAVKHHPALPWREVPAFMCRLRMAQGMAARALEFTVLTAVRTSEARLARWDELDLAQAVWTVPAARTKTGKELRVPLSAACIELLTSLPRLVGCEEYVFPGARGGPLPEDGMRLVLRRDLGIAVTTHGFRSTFRDWAGETTRHPNHVVEMALGHAIANAVEAAYRRGDLFSKRRVLMEDWGRYCTAPEAQVVPLCLSARAN